MRLTLVFVGLLSMISCGSSPVLYGESVPFETLKDTAVALEDARSLVGTVTVSGEVGRVCDAGCWFYLMGSADMVYVKLDLAAGLVIPPDSDGRMVLARGEFEGEGSSAEFRASTVALY